MLRTIKNNILTFRYTLLSAFLCLFTLIGISVVFVSSTPFNPIQHKLDFVKEIYTYTPQGWAFFTRDAREEQVYIYEIDEEGELKKINQKHANTDNFFGISRKVSKMFAEVDIITSMIGKKKFYITTWNYDKNSYGEIPDNFVEVKNPIKHPVLCGDYLLVYHKIAPWAWSNNSKIKMPAKVIKIRVQCQS